MFHNVSEIYSNLPSLYQFKKNLSFIIIIGVYSGRVNEYRSSRNLYCSFNNFTNYRASNKIL